MIKMVGWSQGTTIAFTSLIMNDLSSQVDRVMALGPVVSFEHSGEEVLKQLADMHLVWNIATDMGFLELSDGISSDANSL